MQTSPSCTTTRPHVVWMDHLQYNRLVHGCHNLIKLQHEIYGQDINADNIEKNVIVPPHDPQDIRPESELFLQPALLCLQFLHHSPLMLPKLPLPLASSFVCCPAIKLSFLKHEKLYMKPCQKSGKSFPGVVN